MRVILKHTVLCAAPFVAIIALHARKAATPTSSAAVHRQSPTGQMPADSESSPRIERLRRALKHGDRNAVIDFWSELRAQGAPLLEPLAEDPQHLLVTFLYRGAATTTAVTLSAQLHFTGAPGENSFTRIDTTDVWFRTYRVRADLRFSYGFIVGSTNASVERDPLNPRVLPDGVGLLGASLVELPKAPRQRWIVRDTTVPEGRLESFEVHSGVLRADRRAWVYLPADYDPRRAAPYHLLVCFDGEWFAKANDLPTSLDNLVARHKIPEFIGVFVEQSPQPRRNIELGNNQEFLDFVANELLPAVRTKWHATAEPGATAACGGSSGGLGSAFAAYRRPDVFGNVISESGAFWPGQTRDDSAREWLTRQIEASPKLPIRFVLHVGVVEVHPTVGGGPSILTANRRLRDVLLAKGYDLHYAEVPGGHEPLSWRGGLADGLIELFGRPNRK